MLDPKVIEDIEPFAVEGHKQYWIDISLTIKLALYEGRTVILKPKKE